MSPNLQSGSTDSRSRMIFTIRSIPDFLEDHSLLGDDPRQRLILHCDRWTAFINGLWINPNGNDVCYWIRFRFLPNEGKIKTAFMVGYSNQNKGLFSDNLPASLRSLGFETNEASPLEVQEWGELGQYKYVRVVCQNEESPETMNNVGEMGTVQYLVSPWFGPGGVFDRLFEAFAAYRKPAEVAISLKPDKLSENERVFLEQYAGQATTSAFQESTNVVGGERKNSSDPVAQRLGQVTFDNLTRLGEQPFLTAVYVLAADDSTAAGIARAIKSQIDAETPFGADDKHSYSVIRKINDKDKVASFKTTYGSLDFFYTPSKFKKAIDGIKYPNLGDFLKNRYRFMVDARGAATVFRFPVSVKSGVKGLDVRQRAPDFIPYDRKPELGTPEENRKDATKNRQILLGKFESGGYAAIDVDAFRRHALITGFTGSGKTQTALNLLRQFWINFDIPFLVIESAKQEYRGFLGYKKISKTNSDRIKNEIEEWKKKDAAEKELLIYTLGNSTVSPFFLNPFEIQEGVRVETHISRLTTCFEAALPQFSVLPSVMGEALERVYRSFGWALTDVGLSDEQKPVFPTLDDVETTLLDVIKERGYSGEFGANFPAAVKSRISMLKFGSVGHMLNCPKSSSLKRIFTHPTILELNDLNEQDKSLITMFLLVFLREYRENHPNFERLIHVTMVEEAHNVLEKTEERRDSETGSDSKARAVKSFCNMLTEMRAVGEGMIIADQSPNKLADDVTRNTNVQIVHQLRDAHDRESVANAMIMTKEQCDFVGKLRPGRAALFYTGLERATFIQADSFYSSGLRLEERENPFCIASDFEGETNSFDDLVRRHMRQEEEQDNVPKRRWPECDKCLDVGKKCKGRFLARKRIEVAFNSKKSTFSIIEEIKRPFNPEDGKTEEEWRNKMARKHDIFVLMFYDLLPPDLKEHISPTCLSHWVCAKLQLK